MAFVIFLIFFFFVVRLSFPLLARFHDAPPPRNGFIAKMSLLLTLPCILVAVLGGLGIGFLTRGLEE